MKEFLRDTKDFIEQLYGNEICKSFPLYGKFWDKFIGGKQDSKTGYLLPYGLIIPSSLNHQEISETYSEICHAHYSLFCNLAGAIFQLKELNASLQIEDNAERHFRHWEHFEMFYSHLGICIYQVYHLWGLFFILNGVLKKDKNGDIRGVKGNLHYLLRQKNKKTICNLIDKMDQEITILRNNITHFAREASIILPKGDYAIPFKIEKNMLWEKQLKVNKYQETTRKAKADLDKIVKLFNSLHRVMIAELSKYLKNKKIKIDY